MSVFHILVVDNDPWTVKMVSSLLSRRGHRVVVAHDGERSGVGSSALCVPDLVIADAQHGIDEGLAWLLRLRAELGQRRAARAAAGR
jgi:DNA-binding response OmpR family regulator